MRTLPVAAILVGLVAVGVAGCRPEAAHAPKHEVCEKWPFDAKEAKRRREETAKALGIPVEKSIGLDGGVKLELELVPAGEFMMGGDEPPEEVARKSGWEPYWMPGATREQCNAEQPQHKVRIAKPFYVGKYEVAQEAWERVMENNPSRFKGARNPMENVSWDDCQEFLKKLNGLGKAKATFRLLTEAEWEYACRAGTATAFHTGDTISTDEANYDGNYQYADIKKGEYREKTTEAGSFAPNAFGLCDMHGNVWEWCADWYGETYYKDNPKDDPTGPATGQFRVLRGGSWANSASRSRSAFRINLTPASRNPNFGFRVMVSAGAD
ncbi:MAG: formylglycine-generating enzyme family protein [Armatimonadetes bacterium]|nr:formylglycine-generating enzyme family protein [Armatimonadota bacterium]